jgi:hypothetical protein
MGGPYPEIGTDVSGTGPLGLTRRNGQWFTESGLPVPPESIAVLLKDEETR